MGLLYYDLGLRFALADEPDFGEEEKVAQSAPSLGANVVVLSEWRSYFLKFYGEDPDFRRHLPDSPFKGHRWPHDIQELNFHNHVGRSQLGPLRIRVENRKIGDECFHAMLDDIAERYSNLVFGGANSPVGQRPTRTGPPGRNLDYAEYLFMRRFLLTDNIERIIAAILRQPHYQLLRETRVVAITAARTLDPVVLLTAVTQSQQLVRLTPGHPLAHTALGRVLVQQTGQPLFPSTVPEEHNYHSTDTHENRFVKHVLEGVELRLKELRQTIAKRPGSLINPEIGEDLEELEHRVGACLDDPFWREVGRLSLVPEHSPVLQRREGYRQVFKLYALLRLLTRYDYALIDFADLLETKNTATLYEYWCFFQVKAILDGLFRLARVRPLITEDPVEQKIQYGVSLDYDDGIRLHFNWTAPGSKGLFPSEALTMGYPWQESYSLTFRPDLVISHGDKRLILDAKYKGEREDFYGATVDGTIQTAKDQDLVKMHAYRDAIAGVWGAYALFPGNESRVYPAHNAPSPWSGVGSLALRPGAKGQAEPQQIRDLETLISAFFVNQPHS